MNTMRLGFEEGQSCNTLPAAPLNCENASATSSSVGLIDAGPILILEASASVWFKGADGLGESAGGSTRAGKSALMGSTSAISLSSATVSSFVCALVRSFVWRIGRFAGTEALAKVSWAALFRK